MNILFATYEAAPFFQTGGLGEVSKSLPIALSKIKVDVTLILPKYELLNLPKKAKEVGSFDLEFNNKIEKVRIFSLAVKKGITLYLIENSLLARATRKKGKPENFIFFSKAIAKMVSLNEEKTYGKFDLIHLNDWHVALVPYFLKQFGAGIEAVPTILTIHNLLYQGPIEKQRLTEITGINVPDKHLSSVLAIALPYPDFITVVSPTYAKEIVNTKLGFNLRQLLFSRKETITGILNGIDNEIWNPKTDKLIPFNFSLTGITKGKSSNKLALQKELKLPVSETTPVVSFIGRLEPNQKGIDIMYKALGNLLAENSFQFILLGTGNKHWARKISSLVAKYPRRIVFINKFDERIAHCIYASSDIVLIPSKFEPCGLVQMIAMRYGTLPLVRKTGGLVDTVFDNKTGFVFEEYSATALTRTLRLSIKAFREKPEKIDKMRILAMKENFSWDKSAKAYRNLYLKTIKLNKIFTHK